jgi:hypothetical protein
VKNSLRGATIAARIVQHSLSDATRSEDGALVLIARRRKREHARQARSIEDERRSWEAGRPTGILKVVEEEILNTLVDRAQVSHQGAILLPAERDKASDEFAKPIVNERDARLRQLAKLEIDVSE